jgi:hypothetical protein
MSRGAKVALSALLVLVLVVQPNLSLTTPWLLSMQAAYGETEVATEKEVAVEETKATEAAQEATPATTETAAKQEPVVEEKQESEPIGEATETPEPAATETEEPATEVAQTPKETTEAAETQEPATTEVQEEPTSVEAAVVEQAAKQSVEVEQAAASVVQSDSTTQGVTETKTYITMPQITFGGNTITASGDDKLTYVLGDSGVTMTVGGDAVYTGNIVRDPDDMNKVHLEVGKDVTLTFTGLPQGSTAKVLRLCRNDGQVVDSQTTTTSPCTFTVASNLSDLVIGIVNQVEVSYKNAKVTPANGTFTFGGTGVTCTAKVGQDAWAESSDILAASGDNVALTFDNIPTGKSVTVETQVNGQPNKMTLTADDPNKTFSFNMGSSTQQVNVTIQAETSTTISYQGNSVTPANGLFTFGNTGVTCTAKVANDPYNGSDQSIPAGIGENVTLTFAGIPAGQTVDVEVQTPTGPQTKSFSSTDTDKTFSFVMNANSRQVDVKVNTAATFVLSSKYDATYKSTYATIMYRVDGGAWTDLADGLASGKVTERQDVQSYTYVMPDGKIDLKMIQPTDGTGAYTTNEGKGWAGAFQAPSGSKNPFLVPGPEDFNGTAGYEIDGYTAGTYTLNFEVQFWSLFWDSKVGGSVRDEDVLTNGTCLIQGFDSNPTIVKEASHQQADGTEGYVMLNSGNATVTATLTPARGYQVLSTNIRDAGGSQIALTPDANNACTFTFNVGNNKNMAIAARFTKTDDKATSTSATVSSVALSNAEDAITSGNLDLKVADAGTTDTAATTTAGGGTAVATYDVTLDQYWNQGSATSTWTKNLTTIDTPATVTMQLDDTLKLADGETYKVVRNHEGVETVVDSTYDAATNTLSFSSNQYSEFTLVKTSKAAATTTNGTTTPVSQVSAVTPATSDPLPTALLTALALGGFAVVALGLRRREQL